jgi:ABC-type antimicrobial peptide transport system permease subunit
MNFGKNVDIALRSLAANKLRSALTLLGVMIGVGAVVGLMSLGSGAQNEITAQIESAGGSNLIVAFPGTFDNDTTAQPEPSYLYYEDYEALDRSLTDVSGIAPSFQSSVKVTYQNETVDVGLTATTPDYEQVRLWKWRMGVSFARVTER